MGHTETVQRLLEADATVFHQSKTVSALHSSEKKQRSKIMNRLLSAGVKCTPKKLMTPLTPLTPWTPWTPLTLWTLLTPWTPLTPISPDYLDSPDTLDFLHQKSASGVFTRQPHTATYLCELKRRRFACTDAFRNTSLYLW
jgi:hypothetical protein